MNWQKYIPLHDFEYIDYRKYDLGCEIVFKCSKCNEIKYYNVRLNKVYYPPSSSDICFGQIAKILKLNDWEDY
jgi:hypothetical protein